MTDATEGGYTILAPGFAKWWGSDARALAQAFRRLGHKILDIDEEDYVPWRPQGAAPKVLRRLFGRVWAASYNEAVLKQASSSVFDFVLVFKGTLLRAATLQQLRNLGKPMFNFFPDTNFVDYGGNIPAAMKLYDCVFTTKSFHGEREIAQFGICDLRHVSHGFDAEVHRPVALSNAQRKHYECDVSFVGNWSPENEERILYVLKNCEGLSVRVYGLGWSHASGEFAAMMGESLRPAAFGDELAVVYCASKINLGLLRRATTQRDIADQVTARTFQIPATKSFMLHEDTSEVRSLFVEGEEVLLFKTNEDLVAKIALALKTPSLRASISQRGYDRCMREQYDYTPAAQTIINYFSGKAAVA